MVDETAQPDEGKEGTGNCRIVVFDDQKYVIEEYEKAFTARGFHYLLYQSPKFDKDRLIAFRPDLLIVDLMIGLDMSSGLEIVMALKRIEELAGKPIIVCSRFLSQDTEAFRALTQQPNVRLVQKIDSPFKPPMTDILEALGKGRTDACLP